MKQHEQNYLDNLAIRRCSIDLSQHVFSGDLTMPEVEPLVAFVWGWIQRELVNPTGPADDIQVSKTDREVSDD